VVDVEKDDGDDCLREDEVANDDDERRKDASGNREARQFQLFLDVCPAVALCTANMMMMMMCSDLMCN